jgi:hypothetical protein
MSTTVLDIVQTILSDIDSDEVNSIGDTIEAGQLANIVKQSYENIVDEFDLQNVKQLFQLVGLGDTARPTVMQFPEGIHSVEWIKYNTATALLPDDNWVNILMLDPSDFMDHVTQHNTEGTDMVVANNVSIKVASDRPPQYWTTFDGTTLIFDAYDIGVNSSLISSKTNCYGQGRPVLVLDDTTPIPLPQRFITLLTNECRKVAFDLYKDGIPVSVLQASNSSRVRSQRTKHIDRMNRERNDLPDYGRNSRR